MYNNNINLIMKSNQGQKSLTYTFIIGFAPLSTVSFAQYLPCFFLIKYLPVYCVHILTNLFLKYSAFLHQGKCCSNMVFYYKKIYFCTLKDNKNNEHKHEYKNKYKKQSFQIILLTIRHQFSCVELLMDILAH